MFGLSYLRLGIYAVIAISLLSGIAYVRHLQKVAALVHVLKDANDTQFDTIERLQAANAKWQKTCKPAEIFLKLQEEQLRAEEKIASLVKENSFLRAKDENLPQCVALLQASLSRACPNISTGLRKLASENDHGGSARTGR